MDYHAHNRSQYGILRILAYRYALRDMEEKWTHFKEEPCNVRISLETDGVNPYAEKRSIYSVWPNFVINNKIHPWLPIKMEHIMLATIIPGICLHQFFLI